MSALQLVSAVISSCLVLQAVGLQTLREAQASASNVSIPRAHERAPQVKAWINAFGRSGSSTLLSMVEAAESTHMTVLGLFEPTHDWPDRNMASNFLKLMQCNISAVPALYGLSDVHSTTNAETSAEAVAKACSAADVLAVKTINVAHNMTAEVLPLLDKDESLKVLYLVRDPRGILASQQETPGSFDFTSQSAMLDICDIFWDASLTDHPRIMRVVFEELVSAPETVARNVYSFLGFHELGEAQKLWIEANFDAPQCVSPFWRMAEYVVWMFGGSKSAFEAYDDCRSNSDDTTDKWRDELSTADLKAFEEHSTCRSAADFYRWPRGVMEPRLQTRQYTRFACWLMVIGFLTLVFLPMAIFYSWCCRKSVEHDTDAAP